MKCQFITYLLLVYVFSVSCVHAAEREDAIKAGLIFNFAAYSHGDWFNADSDRSYNICSQNKPFVEIGKKVLKHKVINSRPVKLIFLTGPLMKNTQCHSYYFANKNVPDGHITHVKTANKSAMLIGETPTFIEQGGHINFIVIAGKLRFEINPDALNQSGINISSKVIRLGKIKRTSNRG